MWFDEALLGKKFYISRSNFRFCLDLRCVSRPRISVDVMLMHVTSKEQQRKASKHPFSTDF